MNKLYLIDAYALIFRAYYAFIRSPRINSKGFNTSAVFGFINTFEEIINREHPSHLAVVFDPAGPTFRHKEFQSYKANRDATPEDIHAAVPYIKQIMQAYGVKIVQQDGYEADDVIGTLARKAEKEGFDVYMITPDKDYGQLVSDHVFIIKPRTTHSDIEVLGVKEVMDKWGISSPAQVIDLLGLMGDTADNIPGCPGVGEKTAVKLINDFGSIENIIASTDKLKGVLKQRVIDNVQQILDSKYLATICTDAPVDFKPEEFAIGNQDTEALIDIFTRLEFKTHLAKLQNPQKNTPAEPPSLFDNVQESQLSVESPVKSAGLNSINHEYKILEDDADIQALVNELTASGLVAFSLITDSDDSMLCLPVGLALTAKPNQVSYIPFEADTELAMRTLGLFCPLFASNKVLKIGHSIKHQLIVLARYGVPVADNLFDTEVAHYLLQPEMKHDLPHLAFTLLNYTAIQPEKLFGAKGKKHLTPTQVSVPAVAEYVSEMADLTLKLYHILLADLEGQGLTNLFSDVEMPLLSVLARMEMNGVLIDDFALSQISDQLTVRMNKIEADIRHLVGSDINVSSPRQVGELLFDTLQLSEKAKKTKSGQYSTDEETLEALRSKHPVVGWILEYRALKKLLSTYVDALPRLINPHTGRVHTSFNQTVTATGRLSSSNPNLQNIPIRNELGRDIRKAFIATEGHKFVSADYSQVELRIMAHISDDENMVAAFNADYDIHAATAANIYHLPIDSVNDDMRRKAKTANFGIIYGISAFGLSERLGIARSEAKELIDGYFVSFPAVRKFIDSAIEQARRDGYVQTLMHRRRYLADINSRNAVVRSYAERNAVNAPIQGTAADIIKVAMVRIDRRLREEQLQTKMILQVHDELNFDVPDDELDKLLDIVKSEMESAYRLSVPLKVDIGIGNNWLEAH